MKAFLLFGWVLLGLVGCNPAGPQFPPGADETYDWGIKYARFGDEWWSVRNGEKRVRFGFVTPTKAIL